MASEAEIRSLRTRISRVLSDHRTCYNIRFQLSNARIQTFMYSYIANAIAQDYIHLSVESGVVNHYDHETNTLTFDSLDVPNTTIVHESTHAILDATHVGQEITIGVHEATAYLAEMIYAIYTGDPGHGIDIPHAERFVRQLAQEVKAFNDRNPGGSYLCPAFEVSNIISAMEHSQMGRNMDQKNKMDGIVEAPHRGLLGHMYLESKRK